ncbi:MAG: hypothetical protein HC830_03505 [Bacteroidetes bacterium]|nr:hypothetical protein [Bacteroidota bacterium]
MEKNLEDIDDKIAKLDDKEKTKYEARRKELKEKNKALKYRLDNYKDGDEPTKFEAFQKEFQHDFEVLDRALDEFFVDNK